jgi:small-conductance mechanosensitive channel
VIKDPSLEALVVHFGPSSLSFELRAWTNCAEDWTQIRTTLAVGINSVSAKKNISVP